MYQPVLGFWFEELSPKQWWSADSGLDEQVRTRFSELLEQASLGELFEWRVEPRGRLAEVIVLDQFSRNIHRGSARAFANDGMALVLAQEAVSVGAHLSLLPDERNFLLMPYMHSESRFIHRAAESLLRECAPEGNYEFEIKHKAVIDRFGRYPHRNKLMGRQSTTEEIEYLNQPGAGF